MSFGTVLYNARGRSPIVGEKRTCSYYIKYWWKRTTVVLAVDSYTVLFIPDKQFIFRADRLMAVITAPTAFLLLLRWNCTRWCSSWCGGTARCWRRIGACRRLIPTTSWDFYSEYPCSWIGNCKCGGTARCWRQSGAWCRLIPTTSWDFSGEYPCSWIGTCNFMAIVLKQQPKSSTPNSLRSLYYVYEHFVSED